MVHTVGFLDLYVIVWDPYCLKNDQIGFTFLDFYVIWDPYRAKTIR